MMVTTLEDLQVAGTAPKLRRDPSTMPFGRPRYRCDGCGGWHWPWLLVDVRALTGVTQDWACDGCRSDWKRHLTPVDGGGPCVDAAEWDRRFRAAIAAGGR